MKGSQATRGVRIGACFWLAAASGCASRSAVAPMNSKPPARPLIVVNARLWTADPDRPTAEAMTVRDGLIVAVGTRAEAERACPGAEILDCGGRRVTPGLIDSHLHLVSGGASLGRLAMRDLADRRAFVDAVAARARQVRPGGWLLGRGWSTDSWANPSTPTRDWIDPVTGDVPALLHRMDGHCALANTAALRLAGIDRADVPDPPGGAIERDAAGRPTGILKESAIELVAARVPPAGLEEQVTDSLAAMREANRFGVTAVATMSEWADVAALQRVHADGRDTLRVAVYVMEADWTAFVDRVRAMPVRDDRLWIAGFKAFVDGSLGSRTAYMREPFADRPDTRGLLSDTMLAPGRMSANLDAADAAGLQSAIHAIGDEANHLLLNLYADLAARRGARDRRQRIEHAQHLLPDDIPRFARQGVIASMQPFHKADDARYAEVAIGPRRCRSSYAFRDLLASGATLAFGSDWPVVTVNPMAGVHAAVTGRTLDGRTWMTHQNLTVEEALTGYTRGAAFALHRERRIGRLAPGMLADFTVFETDPLSVRPDDLAEVRVASTYVGGRRVWPLD